MTAEQIVTICGYVAVSITVVILIVWGMYRYKYRTNLGEKKTESSECYERKTKIEKKLAKCSIKPSLILCKHWYLWAIQDLTEIDGVPIVYAGLSGKPYVFVWLNDSVMELNEQCEKILKEQKK